MILLHRQVRIQQAHRLLVARTGVIVAQQFQFVQLATYHTQHVVAEYGSILAHHHEWLKTLLLGLGQQLAHIGCQLWFLHVQLQTILVFGYLVEHRLVHQSQYRVLRLVVSRHYTVYFGFQRVGCYRRHRLCAHQFCFQQLSVLRLFLGLLYYLLQHLILRLRQVLLLSILHLLPECRIRLSKYEHRHDQSYSYQ